MDTQLTPGVYRARQFIRKFHSTYREIDAAADAGVIERLRHGWYATPGADPAVVAAVSKLAPLVADAARLTWRTRISVSSATSRFRSRFLKRIEAHPVYLPYQYKSFIEAIL